jgi:hypothetical protein
MTKLKTLLQRLLSSIMPRNSWDGDEQTSEYLYLKDYK